MFLYDCTSQIEILEQIENATYLIFCCVFIGNFSPKQIWFLVLPLF